MLKKLTEEKLAEILEVGISEFAACGPQRASMSAIAQKAGISVGVLYKYYENKDAFFLACLRRSLNVLREVLQDLTDSRDTLLHYAEKLIRAVQRHSREHADYVRLYQEIACGGARDYAPLLAREIEGLTAGLYAEFIARAKRSGDVRSDMDPRLFAFFFDNLLTTLQFSYCGGYFEERFKLYCGDDVLARDDLVAGELLKFLESAFTLEQRAIVHRAKNEGEAP